MNVDADVDQCDVAEDNFLSQFSPFTSWILRIELRLSGLAISAHYSTDSSIVLCCFVALFGWFLLLLLLFSRQGFSVYL